MRVYNCSTFAFAEQMMRTVAWRLLLLLLLRIENDPVILHFICDCVKKFFPFFPFYFTFYFSHIYVTIVTFYFFLFTTNNTCTSGLYFPLSSLLYTSVIEKNAKCEFSRHKIATNVFTVSFRVGACARLNSMINDKSQTNFWHVFIRSMQ